MVLSGYFRALSFCITYDVHSDINVADENEMEPISMMKPYLRASGWRSQWVELEGGVDNKKYIVAA